MNKSIKLNFIIIPELIEVYCAQKLDISCGLDQILRWFTIHIKDLIDIGIDVRLKIDLEKIELNDDYNLDVILNITFLKEIDEEEIEYTLIDVMDRFSDLDDDGNFPVLINDDEYLISGKVKEYKIL